MMIWDSVPRHSGTRCVVLFDLKTVEKLHELAAPAREPRDTEPRDTEMFDMEELESLLNLD